MTERDLRGFRTAWEQAGSKVSALLDNVAAVAVVGDDPLANRSVATGLALSQALRRRVFLCDLSSEGDETDDGAVGVSDMIRYGISLGRASVPSSQSPNLFVLGGGVESPLAPDVLGSPRWRALSAQVHDAGGLLLVCAPAAAPDLQLLASQMDGAVLVGEVANSTTAKTLATVRVPESPPVAIPTKSAAPAPSRRSPVPMLAGMLGLLAAIIAIPQIRRPVLTALGLENPVVKEVPALLEIPARPAPPARALSSAGWAAEVRYLSSRQDAASAVAGLRDSFPVVTYSEVRPGADSTAWYRVLVGAFADSITAENFLISLRRRGMLADGSGTVTYAPFAVLVDSASDEALLRLRVSGYHGRGLPAYALRDSSAMWHIYVGAFSDRGGAERLKLGLDSLTIQSAIALRAGSSL